MGQVTRPKVSIIIVYYGKLESLFSLILSIKKTKNNFNYEIIVVDNKAEDNIKPVIKKRFKEVIYIKSPGNIGYGAGNNLGAMTAKGEYLFIANPDTVLIQNSLNILTSFLEKDNEVAVVAPNLYYPSGKLIEHIGTHTLTPIRAIFALSLLNEIFPNNFWSRCYFMKDKDKKKLRQVDTVPGSAFMIRKSVFENVGKFDEKMFLYFEEMDLGKRIRDRGYKIYVNPEAKALHYWKPGQG